MNLDALTAAIRMARMQFADQSADMSADNVIRCAALADKLDTSKSYTTGRVILVDGYPYKCRQDIDLAQYTDVRPSLPAWPTFFVPYHGTTPATALPWVAPTCAEDMYKAGEYMIWTDGTTKKCIQDTAYSPNDYAAAWEDT